MFTALVHYHINMWDKLLVTQKITMNLRISCSKSVALHDLRSTGWKPLIRKPYLQFFHLLYCDITLLPLLSSHLLLLFLFLLLLSLFLLLLYVCPVSIVLFSPYNDYAETYFDHWNLTIWFKQNLVWSQSLKTHSWATTILLFMLAKNSKYNPVMGAWPAYTQLERPNIDYLR